MGTGKLTPTGLEHPSKTPIKPHVSEKRGTESGTPATTPAPALPDDLAEVVAVWANLPAALKAGILAMVKAAKT